MIILNTSATPQALSVIPREYTDAFSVSIRDDSTNIIKYYDITSAVTSGNYLNFNLTFNPLLVENHFYDLRLYIDYNYWNTNYTFWNISDQIWNVETEEVDDIYKDKIFCTDQDVDQLNKNDHYKLNKGQFTFYEGFNNTYTVR